MSLSTDGGYYEHAFMSYESVHCRRESRRKSRPRGKHWSAFALLMVLGCLLFQTLSPLDYVVSENKIQQCVAEMMTRWVPVTILSKSSWLTYVWDQKEKIVIIKVNE